MKLETLIFGGIETSICMWSGQAFASNISTFLYSHSVLIIFPMSALILLYIIFLLYFGANTIDIYNSIAYVINFRYPLG